MADEIENYIESMDDTLTKDSTQEQQQQQSQSQTQEQAGGDFRTDEQTAQQREQAASSADNKQGQQAAQDQQQQQGQQAAEKSQLRRLGGGNFADQKGNIVDESGRVLARAGAESRLYVKLHQTSSQLTQAQQRIRELEDTSTTSQALNGLPQRLGLNNDDVTAALDLAAKVRRGDAVGAAKEIVAILAAQGHNITDLFGAEVGDSVEMKAIKRMLDDRFAPFDQQRQSQQQDREVQTAARREYDKFVSDNEFAELHQDDIVLVMKSEGLTAQQAYNKLMHFAARIGIDPSQPFEPQIRELQARQGGQQQQQQGQRQQPAKPMLNGGRGGTLQNGGAAPAVAMADPNDDWSSIINGALRG